MWSDKYVKCYQKISKIAKIIWLWPEEGEMKNCFYKTHFIISSLSSLRALTCWNKFKVISIKISDAAESEKSFFTRKVTRKMNKKYFLKRKTFSTKKARKTYTDHNFSHMFPSLLLNSIKQHSEREQK